MIKKKNAILTFIFSMLPGAGEMYMGFMKQGVSLMSMFLPASRFVPGFVQMFRGLPELLYGATAFSMHIIYVLCRMKNLTG